MQDIKQASKSLSSEVQSTTSEYKEITELIGGLRTRALLLRRQLIYFNGAEYETLHCFIRRFSLSMAEMEE
ncbi:unnamed protein product [Rodentolepis nana]|uniref:Uncharacterized protein n=1 Tax=Rodentolepis nana TaxID=102285 RepID=A0A0R3TUF9_RODNA|nr:unnamed protein product [Rodentolepis nana]